MLKLLDILNIPESQMKNYKVHFAIGAREKTEAYNQFLIGGFKEWQEQQTNKNFSRPYILSLIERETFWKEVLQTRKFGLNKN